MSDIGGTEVASEEPSIVDAVGFGGSEFDPGVWAVGEADPFGQVWVNVESGVVVESLGGEVIDPSEIDGRVDIEYMPSAPVGLDREWSDLGGRDLEFDPETGAFVGQGLDGGFEVVGWTADAADEVGWVGGVGFYHAGTGEWYDAGLNVVEGGLAEGGRYVPLSELSDEQRAHLLFEEGVRESEISREVGELFFDPVTGTLHAYDPEAWAYDGSTWVNLENGATADSPTGDVTGHFDGDLRTLREEGGVDAVGFGGSEFDPGVWAVGEADPFGQVWVNVESGVVVESLGGEVIDPSEIDGRVDIEYMPSAPVGLDREWSDLGGRDLEFDPETGAFVGQGLDGGFEVVGWTADAADEVGWVGGVGFYHAGTGEWYDAGLNVVEGGLAEGGRYVPLSELSDEQRAHLLFEEGVRESEISREVGELFFDPVTGTLHAYDPEAWAYDGSTWVNLENGATADSPTGDVTGHFDGDLRTLREEGGVDAVGFGGSEFDPGVWAVGEADPFGQVWVNVESGVVVESLGGEVIDPSEIDGRVDIEYMPSAPVGLDREWSDLGGRDLEFDPETGAFVGQGLDGGFEVVGWTADAADEVGWVGGVGFYHAGTGEWYDAGLNVVEGGLAEGGRYVPLSELSDEQRAHLLFEEGVRESEISREVGELFFDPVTGTLHAYDPEAWAYDGSTWVNLENGATADSPTGDVTGEYDYEDLRTLQEQAAGEDAAEREPTRDEVITEPEDAVDEEDELQSVDAGEPPPLEPEETASEPDSAGLAEATTAPPTAVEGEPEPLEVHEPEAADAGEEPPTAEMGEPEPLEVHDPDTSGEPSPAVSAEPGPEVIVAPTESPTAEVYDPGSKPEEPESLEERTSEAYEPQPGEPVGGGSPLIKDEPETMEGAETDAVVAEPKPVGVPSEPEPVSASEPSEAQTSKPEPALEEAGGSAPDDVTKPQPEFDVGTSPPPVYSPHPDPGSLHAEYGPDPSDEGLTADEITEGVNAAQDTDSVDLPPEFTSGTGDAPSRGVPDVPGTYTGPSEPQPTKPEPESDVGVSPTQGTPSYPDSLPDSFPGFERVPRGAEEVDEDPPAEEFKPLAPTETPTVEVYEPEPEPEVVVPRAGTMRGIPTMEPAPYKPEPEVMVAPTETPTVEVYEPEPEVVVAPTETPTVEVYEPEPEVVVPRAGTMRGIPTMEPAPYKPEPEVIVAPTETPTVEVYEPEPEVVVAPTETPTVELYEPEPEVVVPRAGTMRGIPTMEPAPYKPEPEVMVAPTETPTVEVYEPEPEVMVAPTETPTVEVYEPEPEVVVAPTETPTVELYEPEPEVVVAPTETPTVELYEADSDSGSAAWKGFGASEFASATDRQFGEWTPVESSRTVPFDEEPADVVPGEPITDPGGGDIGQPETPGQDQTPVLWEVAPELEVREFEVEPVPMEPLVIEEEFVEMEATDLMAAGAEPPLIEELPEVLRDPMLIETDFVDLEQPIEGFDVDMTPMADAELLPPPSRGVESIDLLESPDVDEEDDLEE